MGFFFLLNRGKTLLYLKKIFFSWKIMFSQRQDQGEGKISVIPIQINNTVSEFAKLVSYRKTEKGDNTYI